MKKYEAEGEGRKYFETRGITEGAIEEFKLGFAPKNSDKLTNLLLEKKFTPKELVDSGLVSRQDDAEKLVDTMQDCLVIPATDIFGFVLGIGGRILESAAENDSPKFFDIPHSVAFDNKNFIFGVKKSVNSLVVVNDYTDVVFLNGAGVKNVVASSDGLLNESRLRFLLKYAKRIIFCREKSEISQDKLTKLLSVAKDFENKVFFFSIPEGCALQTFIRKNGKGKFFEIVRNALSIFDLRLQNILNQNAHSSSEEKIETLKKIFQIVPGEKKADVSEEYLKKISDALELEKDKILEEWRKFQSSPPAENKVELRPKKADSPEKFSQDDRAFARLCVAILRTCWYEDALSDFALSMIPNEEFSEVHKEILEYIKKNSDEERSLELSQAENELSKEAYAEISKILAGYGDELKDEDRKAFNDSVRTARRICLQKSYDAKIAEAQQYFGQNDYDSYQKISKETDKLRKEIDRLQ